MKVTFELYASLAAIAVLLVVSAFFSASETGLTTASRARIHHLARRGNRRAVIVGRLREKNEQLIGSILLGSNLVTILASALATSLMIEAFGDAGIAYATVAMTVLVVVFGEVMPKTYALNHADRVALALAPAVRLTVKLFAPLAAATQLIVGLIYKLFGADTGWRPSLVSASEEIRSSIELHTKAGRLVKRESDMLGSIFDLAAVEVGRVMIHRKHMELIDAGQPPAAIVAQVLASVHTRLPIWRDDPDNIVGVLHVKDLLRTMAATEFAIEKLDIAAIATPPWFVPETTSLAEQLNSFRARRAHFALVVDEYGTLMGLVTLKDIIEEIVGDIRDEHDRPQVGGVRREADGAFIVDGTVTIRELNREFDWALPDQDATTVAGLVMFEARVIPDQGQVFVFHGFKFQVLRRQRNQITLLRITPLDSATRPDRGDTPAPRRTSTAA